MPKVSVIVPVYNSEKYLSRLTESLLSQDFSDFEIVFINDGSTDNSLKVLKELAEKDKRVKVFSQKNQGIARTRNFGISVAKGEYIMFADNDDWVSSPKYISEYVSAISSGDYDIAVGGYKRINSDGKVIMRKVLKTKSEWSRYIIMAPWAKIYRRDFIVKNKLGFFDYKIGEDVYFNLLAYAKTDKINIIENDDYIWFYNDKSVSNTGQKGLNTKIDVRILLDAVSQKLGGTRQNEFLKYYLRRYTVWYLLFSGKSSSPKQFMKEYEKLKGWLLKNGVRKTLSPWSLKLSGESFGARMSVFMLTAFAKTHTLSLFAKIYCRERK